MAELKARGVAIIYVTHKMDEIFQIADDITIIRDGKYMTPTLHRPMTSRSSSR
jgi:inositol transport system ATP-binding protein